MHIFILNWNDPRRRLLLNVHRTAFVTQIKHTVCEKWSIPPEDQQLVYSGRITRDSFRLDEYGIRTGSTISLVIKYWASGKSRTAGQDLDIGKCLEYGDFWLVGFDTIRSSRSRGLEPALPLHETAGPSKLAWEAKNREKSSIGNTEHSSVRFDKFEFPVVLPKQKIDNLRGINIGPKTRDSDSESRLTQENKSSTWIDVMKTRALAKNASPVETEMPSLDPFSIYVMWRDISYGFIANVSHADTVKHLKSLAERDSSIPAQRLILWYNGSILPDGDCLGDCHLTRNGIVEVEVVPTKPANVESSFDVSRKSIPQSHNEKPNIDVDIQLVLVYKGGLRDGITVSKSDEPWSLKNRLARRHHVPQTEIVLWRNGNILHDHYDFNYYNIKHGDILEVRLAGLRMIRIYLEALNKLPIRKILLPSSTPISDLKAELRKRSIVTEQSEYDIVLDKRILEEDSTLESNAIGTLVKISIKWELDGDVNNKPLYSLEEAPTSGREHHAEKSDLQIPDSTLQLQILRIIPRRNKSRESASTVPRLEQRAHLLQERSAALKIGNWKSLLPLLPEILRSDLRYAQSCWTYTPSGNILAIEIPLTIAGAPVVIPVDYGFPINAGVAPPRDPCSKIDVRTRIDEIIIEKAIETFPEACGFYFLINGLLQVVLDRTLDYDWPCRPQTFGSLEVGYIHQTISPTSGRQSSLWHGTPSSSNTESSGASRRSHDRCEQSSSNTSMASTSASISLSTAIEARIKNAKGKSKPTEAHCGRIGVQTKVEHGRDVGTYLIMSSHVITSALPPTSRRTLSRLLKKHNSPHIRDNWPNEVDVWVQNRKIGHVYKTFDPYAEKYPRNYKHDLSLVKPFLECIADLKDARSPVPNLGWMNQSGWDCLRAETTEVRFLASSIEDGLREAKTIKSSTPSDIGIVGEGIFINQHRFDRAHKTKDKKGKIAGEEQGRHDWNTLISRCILYRVSPDFETPGGQSGIAIYAQGKRSDDTVGAGIIGFQSFVQRSGHVQTYEMDGQALMSRLEKGLIAFYGAFQVPEEIRRDHIIL